MTNFGIKGAKREVLVHEDSWLDSDIRILTIRFCTGFVSKFWHKSSLRDVMNIHNIASVCINRLFRILSD